MVGRHLRHAEHQRSTKNTLAATPYVLVNRGELITSEEIAARGFLGKSKMPHQHGTSAES